MKLYGYATFDGPEETKSFVNKVKKKSGVRCTDAFVAHIDDKASGENVAQMICLEFVGGFFRIGKAKRMLKDRGYYVDVMKNS